MRYDYPLNIDFIIEGSLSNISIPPFLLLPLVENAFKHGDLKAPLKIKLQVSNKQLIFQVFNQIKIKQKDKVGGIGLENIKKRLELIYGDDHQFTINQNESIFNVQLTINT